MGCVCYLLRIPTHMSISRPLLPPATVAVFCCAAAEIRSTWSTPLRVLSYGETACVRSGKLRSETPSTSSLWGGCVPSEISCFGIHLKQSESKNEACGGRRLSIFTSKECEEYKQRIETSLITTQISSPSTKEGKNLLDTPRHTKLQEDSPNFSQARDNPNQHKNHSSISKATELSSNILLLNACSRSGGSGSICSLGQVSGPRFLPRDCFSPYVGGT